jgi:hypothetical protein
MRVVQALLFAQLLACGAEPTRVNQVACGQASCDVKAGQACCFSTSFSCTAAAACAGQALPCDGPEDCAGGQCCLDFNNRFFCATDCDPAIGQVRICHSLRDCTGDANICTAKTLITAQERMVIGQCEQVTCGSSPCDFSRCPPNDPCVH